MAAAAPHSYRALFRGREGLFCWLFTSLRIASLSLAWVGSCAPSGANHHCSEEWFKPISDNLWRSVWDQLHSKQQGWEQRSGDFIKEIWNSVRKEMHARLPVYNNYLLEESIIYICSTDYLLAIIVNILHAPTHLIKTLLRYSYFFYL